MSIHIQHLVPMFRVGTPCRDTWRRGALKASIGPIGRMSRIRPWGRMCRGNEAARMGACVSRAGFTLIELLVAIALLAVLVGLAIKIIPGVTDGQQTIRAATQLQQWIEIAKQQAASTRSPRGIRFVFNSANPTQIIQLEFVEQPDPYTLGAVPDLTKPTLNIVKPSVANVTGTSVTTSTSNIKTLTGGLSTPLLYPVQTNDASSSWPAWFTALRMFQVPPSYRCERAWSAGMRQFTGSPVHHQLYRIISQPRPLGDDPMQMTQDVFIDLKPRGISAGGIAGKYDLPVPTGTQPLDIIFAPDGRVMPTVVNNLAAYDKIILWVRDSNVADGLGDPTLIVVYPRTGLIAAHPVDVAYINSSPYTFTSLGRRSD